MPHSTLSHITQLALTGFAILVLGSAPAAAQSADDGWQDLDSLLQNTTDGAQSPAADDGWVDLESFEGTLPPESPSSDEGWRDLEPIDEPQGARAVPLQEDSGTWRDIDDDIAAATQDMVLPSSAISAGDLIDITVAKADSLSGAYRVSDLGTLVLPLIGTVEVAGLNAPALELELERLYGKDYLVDPEITVTTREKIIGSVTLSGRVNRAGAVSMTSVLSLADALNKAGGVQGPRDNLDAIILRKIGDTLRARRVALDEISLANLPGPTLLPGDQINILERQKFAIIKNDSGQFPLLDRVLNGGTLRDF